MSSPTTDSIHILAEAEALSDRVTIISQGRTIGSGGLEELRRGSRTKVHATASNEPITLHTRPDVANVVVSPVSVGDRYDVRFDVNETSLQEALSALFEADVQSLTVRPPSLDELFLDAYAGAATR